MNRDRVTSGCNVPDDINVIIGISARGDPLDVLVTTPVPLISGPVIRCRPVGIAGMTDDSGPDPKILAVPIDKLSTQYRQVEECGHLPPQLLDQIAHSYQHYKDLEAGKWVRIEGWQDSSAARKEIVAGIGRFNAAPVKPHF